MQNIANNLPEAFTDCKGVTKSHNPAVNVPERVVVPTQNLPDQNKRGRSTVTKDKHPRKPRNTNSRTINANQHQVDRHQLDIENPNNMDEGQLGVRAPSVFLTDVRGLSRPRVKRLWYVDEQIWYPEQ